MNCYAGDLSVADPFERVIRAQARGQYSERIQDVPIPAEYPSQTPERYVISIQTQKYKSPISDAIRLSTANIDSESKQSVQSDMKADFCRELAAFTRLLPSLMISRFGWVVAVQGGKVIDQDRDEIVLAKRIDETHRKDFVLIRQVAASQLPDYIESPESEIL